HIANRSVGAMYISLKPVKLMAAWFIALGALTPLGIVAAAVRFPRRAKIIYGAASLIFVALAMSVASGAIPEEPANALLLIGFLANSASIWLAIGCATLSWIRQWPLRRLDCRAAPMLYLLLWIFGTSMFYVFLSPFIAARHVLLII